MKTWIFLAFFLTCVAFTAVILLFVFADHEETRTLALGNGLVLRSTNDRYYGPDWLILIVTLAFTLPIAIITLMAVVIPYTRKPPEESRPSTLDEVSEWVKSAQILSKGMQIITQSPFGIRAALADQVYSASKKIDTWRKKTSDALDSANEHASLTAWASACLSGISEDKTPADITKSSPPDLTPPDKAATEEDKKEYETAKDALQSAKDGFRQWGLWVQTHKDLQNALQSFDEADGHEALRT